MATKKLPSKFQIGDDIMVTVQECDCANCEIAAASRDVDPETIYGSVVSVRFTRAKVYYDILTDDTSEVLQGIDSAQCSEPYKETV